MAKSPAKKPAAAPKAEPVKAKLPASIVNALPTAAHIMASMQAVERDIPKLAKELERAKKGGAIQMARAYVALHRMEQRIDDILSPLFGEKPDAPGLLKRYKTVEIPTLFEQEGITNVPLAEGFRVGISARFLASIKPDQKEAAYAWLRAHGLGDIITATVNAQTLSAALKKELEDKNVEAPEEMFNVAMVPNTSVTSTK